MMNLGHFPPVYQTVFKTSTLNVTEGYLVHFFVECPTYCLMHAPACAPTCTRAHDGRACMPACTPHIMLGISRRLYHPQDQFIFLSWCLIPNIFDHKDQQIKFSIEKFFLGGQKKPPSVTKRREKPNISDSKSTDALIFLILLLHNQLTLILDKILDKIIDKLLTKLLTKYLTNDWQNF